MVCFQHDQHLGTVADETRRLSRLVDAMLQLSRMENGKTKFEPKRTDIVGLVRGLVTSQEQLFAIEVCAFCLTSETPHRGAMRVLTEIWFAKQW